MKKLLLVIDMQNDFIDGSLGTKEAQKILPAVIEKVREFDGDVIFTRDTHFENYMDCLLYTSTSSGSKSFRRSTSVARSVVV